MDRSFLFIIALALIIFFINLGGPSVYVLDEAKNSGCAMEMAQRHDWIVPTFNNELRTDKPPLHYGFMRVAYSVWGFTPFAARFFSACMGLLTACAVYLFTKKYVDRTAAMFASAMVICSISLAIEFHLGVPDPYLIAFLTLSVLFFYDGFQSGKTLPFLASYLCVSLATLAKGPVAVVFYGLIVLIFLIATRSFSFRELIRIKVPQGIIVFLVVVLPWYIAVGLRTDGEWLRQFFFKHNVGRFTSAMEGHGGFPLESIVILIAGLLPFSFFFPTLWKTIWRERREQQFVLLCAIATLLIVLFFTFSRTILPNYIAPALPFFAMVQGYFWSRATRVESGKKMLVSAWIALVIFTAIPVALAIAAPKDPVLNTIPFVWLYFIPLPVCGLIALILIRKEMIARAFGVYAMSNAFLIILFFVAIYPQLDVQNPVVASQGVTSRAIQVRYFRSINPAFIFSFQKPVEPIQTPEECAQFLTQPGTLIITEQRELEGADTSQFKTVFRKKALFENPVTVILEKR